ncbi:bifunctional diaminohydroxyphosphoribosylaminopyrimidine deaminase/5-amino-6-(5-phosphoribosylamino)uracil reductase RibD [Salipaludibacillus daqingensis]|uniref:bifunctional diaminohydroxyphosphoribosylaminopyrimidine deaminase/5-amino-6-(5-phosphoribosylamino)uracil reductase RibD n=1 Tax=Salipaludibacillus daqingensis TaxID=3041001 RepID=UPI0024743DB9|nr:bifunctional diaminohydroxyphosphoribosylaminopyrimidine deaminase/5-amino-6-(5-phosphoribosylamino)uracil reductase RibD [Salipaludibacillus daqingensis]
MNNHYMELAIKMAKETIGQTSPNPVVGCVIVNNGEIVGLGAHLKAGHEHAERHALQMAEEKARGATMYVTLEPCSHHGRTPPCADAVIEAGISKVYIASTDPNPQVAGQGIERMRKAGIAVTLGIMQKEADELNRVFFHYMKHSKPYVTLKMATSIDGKIATSSGESKWITGDEAREDGHRLRHKHDAILVGVDTVIQDDPTLTTRLEQGGKNPIRIVMDRTLRTPLNAKLVTDNQASTWIVTTRSAHKQKKRELEDLGVEIIVMDDDMISISSMLTLLAEKDITSLLVEGGGQINDSFLRSNNFQSVVKYMAPILIGGENARSSFSGNGITNLNEAPRLEIKSMERIGDDVKFVFYKEGEK